MRGTTGLLTAKRISRANPLRGSWGTMAVSTPKKQSNDIGEGEGHVRNAETEPIVTFSKPPPLPPVLGPVLAFSLLEMFSSNDKHDS